jgi:hypothetical protein
MVCDVKYGLQFILQTLLDVAYLTKYEDNFFQRGICCVYYTGNCNKRLSRPMMRNKLQGKHMENAGMCTPGYFLGLSNVAAHVNTL